MTRIEVTLIGTTPTAKLYGALVSGMVGVPVTFSFDSAWDGLNKTAVFQGCCTKTRALVLTNETTVPYEVLQAGEGVLYIGVEGRKEDGTIVYPSVMARVGSIRTGADASVDPGMKPSPTVYDDIMAEVNAIHQEGVKLAESEIDRIVREYLTENPPEPGEPGADGEDGSAGNLVGGNGYKILAVSADAGNGIGTYTLQTTAGLEVGMEYSVRLQNVAHKAGKIIAINGNDVKVDGYKYIPICECTDVCNYLTIVGRPDLGDVNVGFGSFAAGYHNVVQDRESAAFGRYNNAIGQYGLVAGKNNIVGYAGFSSGSNNEVLGGYSGAIGSSLKNRCDHQLVVGRYNEEVADARFIVGNGNADDDRSNAFVVMQDGRALVKEGTLTTKEYADSTFLRSDMSTGHKYFKTFDELDAFINELAESMPNGSLRQQSCSVKEGEGSANGLITVLTARDWTGSVVPFAKFETSGRTMYKDGYVSAIDTSKGELSLEETFDYADGASTPWMQRTENQAQGTWSVANGKLQYTHNSGSSGVYTFYNRFSKIANWKNFLLTADIDFGANMGSTHKNRWLRLFFRTSFVPGTYSIANNYHIYFYMIGTSQYYIRFFRNGTQLGEKAISTSYLKCVNRIELLCVGNSFTLTIPNPSGGDPWSHQFVDTDMDNAVLGGGTVGFQGTLYDFAVDNLVIKAFNDDANIYRYGWNQWNGMATIADLNEKPSILSGSSEPDDSLGKDGDIYILFEE